MNPSSPKRRVKVTSGSLPSSKIHMLAACHPFSQQLDIVFPTPTDPSFCAALERLETGYGKGKAKLSDVVNGASTFVNSGSNLLAVSANRHSEDSWCIDPRGHLTLSASKETYERLGLVGKSLPFKGHEDIHIIDIPLHHNAHSPALQARIKAAMEIWDRGVPSNLGNADEACDVVYCSNDREATQPNPFQDGRWHIVQCTKNELQDVHVPVPSLSSQPPLPTKAKIKDDDVAEKADDWRRQTQSLFEWVGMACLGAQRLNANDRVDPYVALYTPPTPSRVQNVTHLRWRGLLSPNFVQDVMNTVVQNLQVPIPDDPSKIPHFVSVSAHALTSAPVSYIPYTQKVSADSSGGLHPPIPGKVPLKVPSAAGEDTWCVILERQGDGVRWCLAESLGPEDARWG
ncbi:hypothetical protein BDN70DRAFT_910091 [Pholiota conissans]|uniref:Uncharacterized protein n=1 Tax=Pholiota conissans TaxID=109636 RepID=A0A9P5ZEZ4_9AGAR|nr:hypothetical protein BDN70DRAFT_910091 [Pholiota conissans]